MGKVRLVIGIDYGTTSTAVAFCHSGTKAPSIRDINLITNWPGQARTATNEKVPSQVAYSDDGFVWGNKIDARVKREAWTKLLLDERKKDDELKMALDLLMGDHEDDGTPLLQPAKAPVQIISDFLSGVREHLLTNLKSRYGPTGFSLMEMEMEVVITVPAVWSDKAKDLTVKAVSKAGFNNEDYKVSMIAEPEAAAIYVLREMRDDPLSTMCAGDHFVVCDAGGGTADIITYRVDSVSPIFKVTEAAIGTGKFSNSNCNVTITNPPKGDKCGAVFVDRYFKTWLRKKLGDKNFQKIKKSEFIPGSRLMWEFETAKVAFEGDSQQFHIDIPQEVGIENDETLGIKDYAMKMDSNDMRSIFDPCVNRILTLIDDQIQVVKSQVKYVLLVGGFGKSLYLLNRIKDRYVSKGIEVIKPNHPLSAVVLGAVLERLDPLGDSLIQLRLCRRHYGTPVLERFDKSKHQADQKSVDPVTGEEFATGYYIKWLLSKGDHLPKSAPRKAFIIVNQSFAQDEPRVCYARLVACDGDDQPPQETEDVYEVCNLHVDLSEVPPEKFAKKTGPAGDINVADFKIEITIEDSALDFRLLFDEEPCGSVRVDYT